MSESDREERERLIRDLAYKLWEEAGCQEGQEKDFWYAARRSLDASPEGDPLTSPNISTDTAIERPET